MVFSTQKPARIVIIAMQDDIRQGTCKVKYAMRFAIQEVTQETTEFDQEGNPVTTTVQGWQYEETVDEITIPLYMKPAIAQILEATYDSVVPVLEQNLQLAKSEVPKAIE